MDFSCSENPVVPITMAVLNSIVFSPNMSLGMNVLFNLVQEAAKKLGTNYDVEIIEVHHNLKKDAPSGSAIRLGELIAKVWNKNLSQILVNNRNGSNVVREKGTLALHAVRAGDIIGDHTVLLASNGEKTIGIFKAAS